VQFATISEICLVQVRLRKRPMEPKMARSNYPELRAAKPLLLGSMGFC
jgi:hypothetical protein